MKHSVINPQVLVLVSLGYCYFLVQKIPKGKTRVISLLPVIYLFSILPWSFSSILLRGLFSFFVTWITSFKLLLFCFDRGPLIPSKSYTDFVVLALFPTKIRKHVQPDPRSNLLTQAMARYELVPLLDRPYLATSLQDFWGKRWNRMGSNILRMTVYDPTREALTGIIGVSPAKLVAMITTLVVSGLTHELVFYYMTCGRRPTWEVTCFFVLHGVCMVLETGWKYWVRAEGWRSTGFNPICSVVFTLGFVTVTCYWLLVLPVWWNGRGGCE